MHLHLLLPPHLPLALRMPILLLSQARPSLRNPNHLKHLLRELQINRARKLLLLVSSKRPRVRANLRVNQQLFFRLRALVNLLLYHPSLRKSDKRLPYLLKDLVRLWSRSSIPLVPATPQP